MSDRPRAWRAYFEASIRLQTRLDHALRDASGLNLVDYNVLLALSEAPGHRLRMGELADALLFSRSRLTYLVTSMEKRGLVRREPCAEDGRGLSAVLTAAGSAAFAEARQHHRRHVQELFQDLVDDDDIAVIGRVFTDVRAKLTGELPPVSSC